MFAFKDSATIMPGLPMSIIEELLTWGEYCNEPYRDTAIRCTRNEHSKESLHSSEGLEWNDDGTSPDRNDPQTP
jgi:hypothetical protein